MLVGVACLFRSNRPLKARSPSIGRCLLLRMSKAETGYAGVNGSVCRWGDARRWRLRLKLTMSLSLDTRQFLRLRLYLFPPSPSSGIVFIRRSLALFVEQILYVRKFILTCLHAPRRPLFILSNNRDTRLHMKAYLPKGWMRGLFSPLSYDFLLYLVDGDLLP